VPLPIGMGSFRDERGTTMPVRVFAVDRDDVPPAVMPDRFRHEITFFARDAAPPGETPDAGVWWIDGDEAGAVLEDGVVRIASPLDSDVRAEIELTEEQEAWLEWIVRNGIRRVRLE